MTFERTTDYHAIRTLLTEERAYRRMANDSAPPPSEFPDVMPSGLDYVVASDEAGPCAVFVLESVHPESADVHFCFSPRKWGETVDLAKDFLEWIWLNTDLKRLYGPVPGYNKLALALAEKAGFRRYGRASDAVRKDGRNYDLIFTKIERPVAA